MNHEALFQAIRENPDDDDVRLVYSDWLEDQGEPTALTRAEFIRVQIALTQLAPKDPRREPLRQRESQLWVNHIAPWWIERIDGIHAHFTRGFPEYILGPIAEFLGQAERIWELCPVVRWNLNANAHGWSIGSPLQAIHLQRLSEAPQLAYLHRFCINEANLATPGLRSLLASPYWERLCQLALHRCKLDARGMAGWSGNPLAKRLKQLDLSNTVLAFEGVRALSHSSCWGSLAELILHRCGLDHSAVEELAAGSMLDGLSLLDLSGNTLGVEGARALVRSAAFSRIPRLNLAGYSDFNPQNLRNFPDPNLGADGIVVLVTQPEASHLRWLDLCNNDLHERSYRAIVESPYLERIECLHVGDERAGLNYPQPSIGPIREELKTRFGDRIIIHYEQAGT